MLTKFILQKLANTTSYSRGEDYFYNHHVRRVKRSGNTFTGHVDGSERYDVSLTLGGTPLTESGAEFTCNCPYDFDGICKHSVAFGLAIIDQFGPVVEPVVIAPVAEPPTVDLKILWQQTTTDDKLDFLRQLLEKQPDLQAQFVQFTQAETGGSRIVFFTKADNTGPVSPDAISTAVFTALTELRFDDDGLEMDGEDYYSEESPDPNPLIESVLTEYADQVIKAFREGRLTDAMTVYVGVYEGTQSTTEPEADEYGIIDDYPAQTWEVWHDLLTDAHAQLAGRVLHVDQISHALDQLAGRVQHFDNTDEEHDELYFDLKPFEPLLLALVTDMPSARAMQQVIDRHKWQQRGTEYVQLRIADVLRDPDLWKQTANQFADHDPAIALQLLQRQRQTGDMPVLIQTLHRLMPKFSKTFDDFILANLNETLLTPGPDLTLYLTALENRCRSAGQLDDYLKLRAYWTPVQRRQFADSLLPKSDPNYVAHPLFYAQVLHTEGMTSELLAWLKAINWRYAYSLDEILKLAAQTHPSECLDLTRKQVISLLEKAKRDRSLYNTIAGWLAALSTIPSLKPQVAVFAGHLLATHSRLTALRDEFRLKGLAGRK